MYMHVNDMYMLTCMHMSDQPMSTLARKFVYMTVINDTYIDDVRPIGLHAWSTESYLPGFNLDL